MTRVWHLRAIVLTLVGALVVHHGRYVFARPQHEHRLAGAHAYLPWASAVAAALVFLVGVHLAAQLRRPSKGGAAPLPGVRTLWPAATLTLLAVFGAQEALETLVAHGHPPTPAELLGGGGWTALPLALGVGGAIALLLRGADLVVRWALARARSVPRAVARTSPAPRAPILPAPRSVLARRLAGRGPPLLSSSP